MELPDFQGRDLPIEPPFSFHGVNACIFPLRASLNAVQLLCDQYLNIVPREVGYFQASIPYVYLLVLDYGKLALKVTNLGWFAQREVAFAIPLEWYKRVGDEWVFQEWAMFTPFIYVDDTLSMTLGRSVHGWPKTHVSIKSDMSNWLRDPAGTTTDFALSADVFSRAYAGRRLEERVFLEVRSPGSQGMRVPVDADNPWFPWTAFSNMARNTFAFSQDWVHMMRGLGVVPMHAASTQHNAIVRSQSAAWKAFPFWPNFSAATLNLKQFRCVEDPKNYCYQALTSGPIRYTAFNRGGLLGDASMAAGDSSGGYSIALTTYPATPLVETLGLQIERRVSDDVSGNTVELKPVLPFWCNVDMEYERATTLAWRSLERVWRDEEGRRYDGETGAGELFNTTLGAGSPVIPGPYHFSAVVSHVLPLLASVSELQRYLDKKLNVPLYGTEERFELWGGSGTDERSTAYVYLVFSSYGDIQSRGNNVGDWANLSIAFYIPVERFRRGILIERGFTPVVAFADTVTQTCTLSELYGMSVIKSTISNARGDWLERDPDERGQLLRVAVDVLPAVGEGQKTRRETAIVVGAFPAPTPGQEESRSRKRYNECRDENRKARRKSTANVGASWDDIKRVLEGNDPWNLFSLMQIRDAAEPSKACYQALHRVPLSFKDDPQLEPIGELYVDITDYPTLQLVCELGLIPVHTTQRSGPVTSRLLVEAPLKIRHSFGDEGTSPTREYYRTHAGAWTQGDNIASSPIRRSTTGASPTQAAPKGKAATGLAPQSILETRLNERAVSKRSDDAKHAKHLKLEQIIKSADPPELYELAKVAKATHAKHVQKRKAAKKAAAKKAAAKKAAAKKAPAKKRTLKKSAAKKKKG